MTAFDRVLLVVACLFSYLAHVDSVEAHKHTHELGCAVAYNSLCLYHKGETP